MKHAKASNEWIVRFNPWQRFEHVMVMSTFTLLCLTGFPQKFYDQAWAHHLIGFFGGPERARAIHRICGIVMAAQAFLHLAIAAALVVSGRARASLVPAKQDFHDAVKTLRYYLGIEDHPARFDRFDYRQKFEYWGLVLGGVLMIATGFILYFPIEVARFLPGEVIPAAKMAHSNEGLMAFLVVITWHIYNAHFSPDTFPFDTAIFTGKISRERMEHEHPLELERLEKRG